MVQRPRELHTFAPIRRRGISQHEALPLVPGQFPPDIGVNQVIFSGNQLLKDLLVSQIPVLKVIPLLLGQTPKEVSPHQEFIR
jgi:hypothetical protein